MTGENRASIPKLRVSLKGGKGRARRLKTGNVSGEPEKHGRDPVERESPLVGISLKNVDAIRGDIGGPEQKKVSITQSPEGKSARPCGRSHPNNRRKWRTEGLQKQG